MKIIISPAKKMNVDTDTLGCSALPAFLQETEKVMRFIQALTYEEAKKLWGCNEKLAELNYRRFQEMELKKNLTPALLSYEGIQYQYMAPGVFTRQEWDYVQEHLRILSGFYGALKPLDGVVPYRLEMQAKAKIDGKKDLYDFWSGKLYQAVTEEGGTIVNLASREYSKCIEKYLTPEDTFVTCVFGEQKDGKIVQKGTEAKMARGEMVRFMAEKKIEDAQELRKFDRLGYMFREDLSSETEYIFVKEKQNS